ncbi:MAG: PqqD family protein [Pseudomonadota bacterium]
MPDTRTTDLTIRRGDGLLEAQVDGEMVALHIDNGTCYGFNGTAYRIWQLIEQPTTLSQLCAQLAAEFAVEPAACRDDVRAVLEDLAADRLVVLTPIG